MAFRGFLLLWRHTNRMEDGEPSSALVVTSMDSGMPPVVCIYWRDLLYLIEQNIPTTTKDQTFTSHISPSSCFQFPIAHPINVPVAHHSHNHYTSSSLPSHPSPSPDNIIQHNHRSIHTSSLFHSDAHRNPPFRSSGHVSEGWDACSASPLSYTTLRLYSLK
jgi:hypothetical protein